ncbi:MAG: restriction endonuclease, partial [Methanosarcinales archaeon]|nr:restriction endonuclease [Methanosarcinales archaeon]
MDIDWSKIEPKKFEELCHRILTLNGFANIQWFGKYGSDRGRDLVAEKVELPLPGIVKVGRWIIQCKRFISRPPTIEELNKAIIWNEAHKADYLLFIITNVLTSDTKDWIVKRSEEVHFSIFLWEEPDIKNELTRHPELLDYMKPSEENELEEFAIKFIEFMRQSLEEFHPKILHVLPMYSQYPYGLKIVRNTK